MNWHNEIFFSISDFRNETNEQTNVTIKSFRLITRRLMLFNDLLIDWILLQRNYGFKQFLFFAFFFSSAKAKKKCFKCSSLGLELGLYFAKCSMKCSTHFFCQFQSQIFTFTKKKIKTVIKKTPIFNRYELL